MRRVRGHVHGRGDEARVLVPRGGGVALPCQIQPADPMAMDDDARPILIWVWIWGRCFEAVAQLAWNRTDGRHARTLRAITVIAVDSL
jgi:hypothetical protein